MAKLAGKRKKLGHGLEVWVNPQPAKKSGKNRLWLHIRHSGGKRWQIDEALLYVNSADIRFIEIQSKAGGKSKTRR